MKPHEETWHASMTGYSVRSEDGTIIVETRGPFRERQVADLELCAAAPDLVRALLDLRMTIDAVDAGYLVEAPRAREVIDAALRKAGVR